MEVKASGVCVCGGGRLGGRNESQWCVCGRGGRGWR